ncbi:DUF3375 family protein [Streptomyces sp. NPDC005262]|uniref:DUF3375 family protein n=1 Tax=Streptomyces sp. NPDC005262 TaxID=3364710 RepID=UPI0036906C96
MRFVEQGARPIAGAELVERLDDELFALNDRLGQGTFPKSAKAYLDDWSAPGNDWLRKYYPPDSDEPHYDATAAVEKAIAWVRSLEERSFVGTESRLNTIFDLLRQMTFGTETDPRRDWRSTSSGSASTAPMSSASGRRRTTRSGTWISHGCGRRTSPARASVRRPDRAEEGDRGALGVSLVEGIRRSPRCGFRSATAGWRRRRRREDAGRGVVAVCGRA